MIARLYNMKMNAEMVQEDALFAKQMSTVHETKPADCSGFESSDAELAFQQQLEFMVQNNYTCNYTVNSIIINCRVYLLVV